MNTTKTTRLLGLVCLLGLSSGLIAYSAMGVKHQVSNDQVGEVAFTHLSHSGAVQRGSDGGFIYAEGCQPEESEAAKAVPAVQDDSTGVKTVQVAETKPAAKPTAKPAAKPTAKKTEPAKAKSSTAKKPAGTTAKKPTATKPKAPAAKPPAKKTETKKPAEKAPAADKKPAPKPACPT